MLLNVSYQWSSIYSTVMFVWMYVWVRMFEFIQKRKKNFMALFYECCSTASRLEPLGGGSLLLPLSPQKFLVLTLSTLEGWKAESTLEPPSGFEYGIPELGIQRLNHQAIAPRMVKYVCFSRDVWKRSFIKETKNEQLPLSASFTAKLELVFVLIQENAFSERFHFEANRKSIDSTEICY